jgi:eukaryotic-like serine/threonine-protein kinase
MGMTTPARPTSGCRVPPATFLVDATCDRFEAAFRAGRGPQIENYLVDVDASCRRPLLRELLLLEIELSRRAAGSPRRESYRVRFPREADVVDAAFAEAARDLPAARPVVAVAPVPKTLPASRLGPPTVGRYVVLAKLREGREEVVYRVLHPGLGKELVLKWAHHPLADDGSRADSLAKERHRLADLDHPNLVRVVELGDHEGRPYLVIENGAGLDLAQHAARHRPSTRSAAALVADLAAAVAYLHGREIVHQEIRPENVLIDTIGRPRLIVSTTARLQHAWPPSPGSDERSSPETDVFDLGLLLDELITGHPSRRDADATVRHEPSRVAPRVPKALELICLRALSQVPGDRYSSAAELERVLRHYLRRRGIVAVAFTVLVLVALAICAISF